MENCSEKTFGGVTIVERSDWTCGVVDSTGEIVVPFGKYEEIDGFDHGLARVRTEGVILCGSNGKVETNPTKLKAAIKKDGDIYAKWGIINQKGEEVVPAKCDYIEEFFSKRKLSIAIFKNGSTRKVCCFDPNSCKDVRSEKDFGNVTVIQSSDYQWCVVSADGKMVAPFGKYDWIDDFDQGLARVKIGKVPNCIEDNGNKWGIINEKGEFCKEVYLHELNPKLPVRMSKEDYVYSVDEEMDYGFSIDECFDYEGNFDGQRLDDAIMDGLYVPEDW